MGKSVGWIQAFYSIFQFLPIWDHIKKYLKYQPVQYFGRVSIADRAGHSLQSNAFDAVPEVLSSNDLFAPFHFYDGHVRHDFDLLIAQ